MSPDISARIAHIQSAAPKQYLRWSPAVFEQALKVPFARAVYHLKDRGDATPILLAYLELLREAVAQGYLMSGAVYDASSSESFLEYLLVGVLPELLAEQHYRPRVADLARAWNLAEGLWSEPVWIDKYLLTQIGDELPQLGKFDLYIERKLELAFAALPPVNWTGPFMVSIVDLCGTDERFLPGEMRWVGPRVLCIADRLRPGVQVGLFLRKAEEPIVMGLAPEWGPTFITVGRGPASVDWSPGVVRIGAQVVMLPHLLHKHSSATVDAGFIVASAVDSQRIWIVECAG